MESGVRVCSTRRNAPNLKIPCSVKEKLQNVMGGKKYLEEAQQVIIVAIKRDYGLHCLAAVDLRDWLKRKIEVVLRVTEALDTENIVSLAIKVAQRSNIVAAG
ncbi:hypothetical protein BGW36DRAFT_434135 [Talaromyces proteolyticus]|uniref:Uncharacterized protein n=1 Tax=Talaromyces proteolyticus TaxID=1131652 RepID=A0AAD4PU39_9EURO|nr:uncharacterized protein BGW36DRAFT_434135 [Talaromyces proteolyticus]KAH8688847.1 hypothetical protein BGW36DRAFT_434135 [Talaromyces proteolyticus]